MEDFDFFATKYIWVEFFYREIFNENCGFKESASTQICEYRKTGELMTLIAYSTILGELVKYEKNIKNLSEFLIKTYNDMLEYYNSLSLFELLSEEEKNCLDEDIFNIKKLFEI